MKVALLLTLAFLFAGLAPKSGLLITDTEVTCTINRNVTLEQLKAYKTRLWEEKKITFDIEKYEVDDKNRISRLGISVDCHDGFKGTAVRTLSNNRTKIGFHRSYVPEASTPFVIGKMPFRR